MFPQHEFVGTDIFDEVLEYSSNYHNYPNLSFVKCSAKEIGNIFNILDIDIKNKPVLICAFASLNYVQPEHLTIFFNSLGKFANLKIILGEGGNESKGKHQTPKLPTVYSDSSQMTHYAVAK